MRALIIATGFREGMDSLLNYRPTPLLNVADKPVIFHIIEHLVQCKIEQFDLILHHLPHMIEDKLDDGRRWGINITYHLVKDAKHPFANLRHIIRGWKDEYVLLGNGDSLPKFEHNNFQDLENGKITLWMYPDNIWSGWGLFPSRVLGNLPANATEQNLLDGITEECTEITASPFLSLHTLQELKKTNQKFITHNSHSYLFPTTARMVEPGVWISRGVSLHPTAKVVSPVFIGENTQIKENTTVGPYTIIENNCIVDSGSCIDNSLILQHSYIGESLDLQNSIVDRNLLINLSLESEVKIKDDFILGELTSPSIMSGPLKITERFLGGLLLVLLYPVYFYMQLTHQLKKEPMLKLPANEDPHLWNAFEWITFEPKSDIKPNFLHVHFRRLPLLISIMRGEAHFVGVIPRDLKDVEELPKDWKKLYLRSKVGLITLSDLDHTPSTASDQCYASEVFYATHMGFVYDLKLFLRWLKTKIIKFTKVF